MQLRDLHLWFAGFAAGIHGAPDPAQWQQVKDMVFATDNTDSPPPVALVPDKDCGCGQKPLPQDDEPGMSEVFSNGQRPV